MNGVWYRQGIWLVLVTALLLMATTHPMLAASTEVTEAFAIRSEGEAAARGGESLPGTPVMFIENAGQFADEARFQVRGANGTLWLAEDALWLTVFEPANRGSEMPGPDTPPHLRSPPAETGDLRGVNLRLSFPGANPQPRLEPFDRLETRVSYFSGDDPEQWRPDVPVWAGVRYVDLYPGIDLEVASVDGRWVQRLRADPDADLSQVQLRVAGAEALAFDGDRLHLTTDVGDYILPLPMLEDVTPEAPPAVFAAKAGMYDVHFPFASSTAPHLDRSGDAVAAADNPQQLLYGTFLGGGIRDQGYGVAVDGSGAAYVAGTTWSADFPSTPGAFDPGFNAATDAFVVKLDPVGSTLAYASFLGGALLDAGWGIAVDATGSAYITGSALSPGFPTTPGSLHRTQPGGGPIFVAKMAPEGNALVYSALLGGSGSNMPNGIAVDGNGAAYITGLTTSPDFPTTPGAFDRTYNGGVGDAFVFKVTPDGSDLAYSSFLGGSGYDLGVDIAVDGSGAACITGITASANFPTTAGAFDRTHNGLWDAFVVKMVPGGNALAYATFLGGSNVEEAHGIAVDGSGAAYVTGFTKSTDFPTTPGAFDTRHNRGDDAFVVKVAPDGRSLAYATFLGSIGGDNGRAIAVDGNGRAYVTGDTSSANFPTTADAFDRTYNGGRDVFVVRMNAQGSALAYSTFLGGSDTEWVFDIAIDGRGAAYVTGHTASVDFPTTAGAFGTTYHGGTYDVFVAKLAMGIAQLPAVALNHTSGAPGSFFNLTGWNFPPNQPAEISLNGESLGSHPTDAEGRLYLTLNTAGASEGHYVVSVTSGGARATTRFWLVGTAPMRAREGTWTLLAVPAGIGLPARAWLPLMVK